MKREMDITTILTYTIASIVITVSLLVIESLLYVPRPIRVEDVKPPVRPHLLESTVP